MVLVVGGPPCQGVSGLNASRKGASLDPRSSLNQQFKLIFDWVVECFHWCPVHFFQESVSSMEAKDINQYNDVAQLLPVEVEASQVGWVRRPQLFWLNWKLWEEPGFKLRIRPSKTQAIVSINKPPLS